MGTSKPWKNVGISRGGVSGEVGRRSVQVSRSKLQQNGGRSTSDRWKKVGGAGDEGHEKFNPKKAPRFSGTKEAQAALKSGRAQQGPSLREPKGKNRRGVLRA